MSCHLFLPTRLKARSLIFLNKPIIKKREKPFYRHIYFALLTLVEIQGNLEQLQIQIVAVVRNEQHKMR